MFHVGLTGNIASGKSTVATRLRELGAVVLDADQFARAAVAAGTPGLERVFARFGAKVRAEDGSLDRAALGRIVFHDSDARRDLEAIVHPEVARLRTAATADAEVRGVAVIVSDVPLLFETGLRDAFDAVVLVDAVDSTRLRRLTSDRGVPREEALAMMAAQGDPQLKRAQADWVIENDGSRDALMTQVDAVWEKISARAASP